MLVIAGELAEPVLGHPRRLPSVPLSTPLRDTIITMDVCAVRLVCADSCFGCMVRVNSGDLGIVFMAIWCCILLLCLLCRCLNGTYSTTCDAG